MPTTFCLLLLVTTFKRTLSDNCLSEIKNIQEMYFAQTKQLFPSITKFLHYHISSKYHAITHIRSYSNNKNLIPIKRTKISQGPRQKSTDKCVIQCTTHHRTSSKTQGQQVGTRESQLEGAQNCGKKVEN